MGQLRWVLVVLVSGCFGNPRDLPGSQPDARGGDQPDASTWDPDASAELDASTDGPPADAGPDAPPPCKPLSCSDRGASCGTGLDNGCGAPLDCGTCEATATCGGQGTPNVCAIPAANRECANGWCWESPSPFAFTPIRVFARTTSDVWMIGARGVIKHFDGTRWSAVSSNTLSDLHGIWMASATDGWIVGDAGLVLRWNGSTWTKVASGTTNHLRGVHGTATNVWIVGDRITRVWNGLTWANLGTTLYLNNVFVAAGNKVFGTAGALVYENVAGAWVSRTTDPTGSFSYPSFNAIAGVGSSVYAVGGVSVLGGDDYEWVWHWNGSTWTRIDEPGVGIYSDAWVDNATVYAATEAQVWDMATNVMTNGPASVTMRSVGGTSGEVFAASSQGRPWRYQSGTWTTPPASSVNTSSSSVLGAYRVGDRMWFGRYGAAIEHDNGLIKHARPDYIDFISGTGRDNVWALDRDSFFQESKVDHFDGQHWTQIDGPGVRAESIRATAQEVLVFGTGVFRLDGTTWIPETMPAAATWSSYSEVGTDVFLIGMDYTTSPYTPRIAKRQGAVWTTIPAPATQTICGIAAISATDLWVTGRDRDPSTSVYSATISHWNGSTWTITRPANTTDACAIVASAAGEVWVAGTGTGAVLHRATNGTWTKENGTASGDIRGLAFDANGTLWAAGDNGVIMHR